MKKVVIPEEGVYKCVVLTNGTDVVFRAGPGSFHRNVASDAFVNEPELDGYHVAGGGRIEINPTVWSDNGPKKEEYVRVYGYSVDFGEMDKSVVENLLTPYCEELNITFINESGEGY